MHFSISSNILSELNLSQWSIDILFHSMLCISKEIKDSDSKIAYKKIEESPEKFIAKTRECHSCYSNYSKILQTILYPNRAHVFLLGRPAVSTTLSIYPLYDVPGALRGRYYVKRRWDGSTFLEIADPKFAPREFPLDVGALLITSTLNYSAN